MIITVWMLHLHNAPPPAYCVQCAAGQTFVPITYRLPRQQEFNY